MKAISKLQQLNVLGCQIEISNTRNVRERDQNLEVLKHKIANLLAKERVDLVVLPELCSIEYSNQSFDRLSILAENFEGPSFTTWRSISQEFNTYVVYSFPRRTADGYRITLAVTGPDGSLVGHYDKIFLAQYGNSSEKHYFEAGSELFVFEINNIRLGLLICADIRIPEFSRTLTMNYGVDAILHPCAYSRDTSFYSWHHFAVTRALENQIYFLSLNRAGKDFGNSLFCPPWVDEKHLPMVFDNHIEQFLTFKIDQSEIEYVREKFSFLKDLRDNHNMQLALLDNLNQSEMPTNLMQM